MSAFSDCQKIEKESLDVLRPYLDDVILKGKGKTIRIAKGRLAEEIQKAGGDYLIPNDDNDGHLIIECKAERRLSPNLFIELFSDVKATEDERQRGWACKIQCDILIYHFLDRDIAYAYNFDRLKRWLFGIPLRDAVRFRWRVPKREQNNLTFGFCLPIEDIPRDAKLGRFRPGSGQFDFQFALPSLSVK